MTWRVKDWHKFQHFRDRRPPWIKLYRDILDDPDWHALDGEDAKRLTMIWVLASEDQGALPEVRKLAFRLRIPEIKTEQLLNRLSHWLYQDDISMISIGYQDDIPEREREREGETEKEYTSIRPSKRKEASAPRSVAEEERFEEFMKVYPKRKPSHARLPARGAFFSAIAGGADPAAIIAGARKYDEEVGDAAGTKFIAMASTWLNQERWKDYPGTPPGNVLSPEELERLRAAYREKQERSL